MYSAAESPVAAIRADFRRINRAPLFQRVWHSVAMMQERAADRAAARGISRIEHAGVMADYQLARRPR